MIKDSNPIVCIVGPTASGKTDLAQYVALHLNGEVVSADSMQIYRGMDIGTGKLPAHDRLVAHHGFDIVDPGEPYSASLYQTYARSCFSDIAARQKRSILCGGTGFYVRAAIDDYDFPQGELKDNPVREYYSSIFETSGEAALWEMLHFRDCASAQIIPRGDVKRVIRALELLEEGKSYAEQRDKLVQLPQLYPAIFIGLRVNPEILRNRIDERVDNMVSQGLCEEVSRLLNNGFREGITAPQAIGYKEIVAAFDGDISLDEAIHKIKIATHRYAKRQRTWFRKDERIVWVDADNFDLEGIAHQSLEIIETSGDEK